MGRKSGKWPSRPAYPDQTASDGMLAIPRRRYERLYIGGDWVKPSGSGYIAVVNSTTEQHFGWVPSGSTDDVDRAIRAAKGALPWLSEMSIKERGDALDRIADGIEARLEEIATIVAQEVGTPIERSLEWQAEQPVTAGRLYAPPARAYKADRGLGNSPVGRDPGGRGGCLKPRNFPPS